MLSLCASSAAYSQDERSNRDLARLIDEQLHEFFDRTGMIVGVGRVAEISNKQVLYVDGFDKEHIHDIRDLSKPDQAYCRDLLKQLAAIEQSRKSAKKIEKQLLSSKTKNQIRACIQLRELGIAASEQVPLLNDIAFNSIDPQLAYEALISFAYLCDTSNQNLEFILDHGATLNVGCYSQVLSNPRDFLIAVSRWQEDSIPFLKQVAFTGEIVWDFNEENHKKTPVILSTTNAQKNLNRQYACEGLGNVVRSLESEQVLQAVLVKANTKINNRDDEGTLKAIIYALGNQGQSSKEVLGLLKPFETKFPQVVKSAKAKLAYQSKIVRRTYLLGHGSTMRHFRDKQNKVFLWGKVLSTENGKVLLLDRETKKVAVSIEQFSKADREFISSKFPLKEDR
ncbi:MAG: hypothetical protein ACR2NK_07900 [Mariniblastus sp.]